MEVHINQPLEKRKAFKGLISQRAITFWLAGNMYAANKMPMEVTVGEVLEYETNDNYHFIAKATSVLEATRDFQKAIRQRESLGSLAYYGAW